MRMNWCHKKRVSLEKCWIYERKTFQPKIPRWKSHEKEILGKQQHLNFNRMLRVGLYFHIEIYGPMVRHWKFPEFQTTVFHESIAPSVSRSFSVEVPNFQRPQARCPWPLPRSRFNSKLAFQFNSLLSFLTFLIRNACTIKW